jgi:rare lipoprotein A
MKKIVLALGMIAVTAIPSLAQTGTYYASSYHGKRTASGATFSNHRAMAAHPSLPLGSRVRVTNRNNGRSVVVQVVDRCRCSIDLSQSAFRQIGSLSSGRVPVSIQAVR